MSRLRLVLALAAALTCLVFATSANAAGRLTETVQCDGQTLTILTQPSSGDNWGAVQVVGDGTLIPLAFEVTVYDVTKDMLLASDTDAKGDAGVPSGLEGSLTTCTLTETAQLSDLLEPGEEPPPGTDLTDVVTFTLTATVVVRP
jgi:hypothetical protein